MLTNRDEILIQRCVDGELDHGERRELLSRMDQLPEGWKTLACTFMEEQLFADAANESLQTSAPSPAGSRQLSATTAARKQSWFASPITTLVLSLCVAFLGGLLASGRFGQSQTSSTAVAENTGTNTTNSGSSGSPAAASTVSNAPYRMRVEPVGAAPVELPVFSDTNAFLEQLKEYRRRELGLPENAGAEALPLQATDEEMQFIKLQTPDGKVIVLPIPRQSNFLQ